MKSVYGQFCPVAVASEIFAERWTPVILRELVLGSRRFNDIQRGVPRISRALLVKRLRELVAHGVIDSSGGEYRLTEAGQELGEVVVHLGTWGARWTAPVRRDRLDAKLLTWDMRRRIARRHACPRSASWCASISAACRPGTRRRRPTGW